MFKSKSKKSNSKRDPLLSIAKLMNLYHSIDMMYGTEDEKRKAKQELSDIIMGRCKRIGDYMKGQIRVALTSKPVWESLRERYFNQ